MKKIIVVTSLIVAACSSAKDERFCECLSVSSDLDVEASKYEAVALDKITDEDVVALKSLMHKKDSICEPYELLGGEELLSKKEACK